VIGLTQVYILAGLVFAGFAVMSLRDAANPRRWRNALFWGLFALSFLAGDHLGDLGNGLLVLAMAVTAALGLGRSGTGADDAGARAASARAHGLRLFLPALLVPVIVLAGSLGVRHGGPVAAALVDPKQATLVSLSLAALVVAALTVRLFRQPVLSPLTEGLRLADTVGWMALLPQTLAALGAVFALAGVGAVVGETVTRVFSMDTRLAAVAVYCLGMAGFTVLMGNAFAAFPVMTAGVALPILVKVYGGDPAAICAIGMLSGFCGTLLTPLAANFNLAPAALLDLDDRYAVIRAQAPTALVLLLVNTVLMHVLAFPAHP
jgi:uncharacterized membrane protein